MARAVVSSRAGNTDKQVGVSGAATSQSESGAACPGRKCQLTASCQLALSYLSVGWCSACTSLCMALRPSELPHHPSQGATR